MLHPIFATIVARPDLVADHLSAYLDLAGEEAIATGHDLGARLIAWTLAGAFALIAILLAGVAVMLGMLHGRFHWVLVLVPGAALVVAVAGLLAGRRPSPRARFAELRRQLAADVGLLRAAGKGHDGRS